LCVNCHRQDDIHSNSLSPRCGTCHNQWSFAPAQFSHSKVGCNLDGQHRTLPCVDCHRAGNFGGTSPQCIACHRDDAVRAGMAGMIDHNAQRTCASCHTPTTWTPSSSGLRESICR
jgi:hypothetical protein